MILTWNEFLFALLLTGVETRTVPVAMARTLGGSIGVDYGVTVARSELGFGGWLPAVAAAGGQCRVPVGSLDLKSRFCSSLRWATVRFNARA